MNIKINTLTIGVIFFLSTIISCNTNSNLQKSKTSYYDTNSNLISKTKFQKLINYQFNVDYCINDGMNKNCYLINRIKEGKLTEEALHRFYEELETSTGKEIDADKSIRITYYSKSELGSDCLLRTRNLEYTISLEDEYSDYNNLYIASPKYKFNRLEYEVLIDENNIINFNFFSKLVMCSNYLLINKKGDYISCIGDGCERLIFD